MTRSNWAGNITFNARSYQRPTAIEELQSLIGGSDRVRAAGSGHSFNRIADTDGTKVTVAGLPREIEIDSAARRVRVSAGMKYAEVTPRLNEAGFALPNLGSLPHISIAGACATGTHGSGDANGNLATAVSAIELVIGAGDIVTLSRANDPETFDGAVIALGCLGVVTHMTLDLVPSFEVAQHVFEDLSDESLDANFDAIFAGGYSVSVFTDGRANRIWCKRLASAPAPDEHWVGAVAAGEQQNPVPGMSPANCTEQLGVIGAWHERLPHFRPQFAPSSGAELQSEYLLPRPNAVDALAELRGLRAQLAPVLQVAEVRTVHGDELWLSPSYRRDTVAFHFTWVDEPAAVTAVVPEIEERLAPFAPRPHWGKVFCMAPDTISAQYERMSDFGALMREYDPGGKFRNTFVDRYVVAD